MEGYRSLESGDLRILENGDSRVTEGFIDGFSDLSGSGIISVVGGLKVAGIASLSSIGSAILAGEGVFAGRLNLSAVASIAVAGQMRGYGLLNAQAISSLTSIGLKILHGTTALSGSSNLASVAGFKFIGASDQQASGSLVALPLRTAYGLLGPFSESSDRITEGGDTRITEDGDTRISGEITENVGVSTLVAESIYTAFHSSIFIKKLGNWKTSVVYANVNGEWVPPEKVYQVINGRWKRIN